MLTPFAARSRVRGRFNTTTFDVEGNVMDNKGVYLEVVPGEKLVPSVMKPLRRGKKIFNAVASVEASHARSLRP